LIIIISSSINIIVWTGVKKLQIESLEFVLNTPFSNYFFINSYDVANECVVLFNCSVSAAD